MIKNKKFEKIVCPNCGTEYLPCEIYLPDYFLGKSKNIIKDDGVILDFEGIEPDYTESFICDKCNTPFKVFAKVQFTTTIDKVSNFNEEYVSSLHKDNIELSEEE